MYFSCERAERRGRKASIGTVRPLGVVLHEHLVDFYRAIALEADAEHRVTVLKGTDRFAGVI